jgi:hypothetical protein
VLLLDVLGNFFAEPLYFLLDFFDAFGDQLGILGLWIFLDDLNLFLLELLKLFDGLVDQLLLLNLLFNLFGELFENLGLDHSLERPFDHLFLQFFDEVVLLLDVLGNFFAEPLYFLLDFFDAFGDQLGILGLWIFLDDLNLFLLELLKLFDGLVDQLLLLNLLFNLFGELFENLGLDHSLERPFDHLFLQFFDRLEKVPSLKTQLQLGQVAYLGVYLHKHIRNVTVGIYLELRFQAWHLQS